MLSAVVLAGVTYSLLTTCIHPPPRYGTKHGAPPYEEAFLLDFEPDPAPHDLELLGHMEFGNSASDIWGYAADGREYAIIGLWDRATIVDVTDPQNMEIIVEYPGVPSLWRDMKTYGNYLYIGVDAQPQGIQIVDLSPLPDEPVLVNTMTDVLTSHNLYIDTDRALLYVCGDLYPNLSGMRIYSLADPAAPQLIGSWNGSYVHDMHVVGDRVVVFLGPLGVAVLDMSDPTAPFMIQFFKYPNLAYAHSGWASPCGKYLAINDEFSEMNGIVDRTTIRFFEWDPIEAKYFPVSKYLGPNSAVDHNIFWMGDYAYVSNYAYGLTILDVSNVHQPHIIAKYDTFPEGNWPFLIGAWGVYPFLPSGNILVSDIHRGLYVLEHVPGRDDLTAFHLQAYGFDPLNPNNFISLSGPGTVALTLLALTLAWLARRRLFQKVAG